MFKAFFFVLSYFVPKNNKLLLFQTIIGPRIREEPKYAYLYAKKYLRDYKLMFFLSREEKKEYEIFGIKKHKIKLSNYWKILRAKYIFVETTAVKEINLSSLIGRFNIIMLYHGAFLKDETYIKEDAPLLEKLIGKLELGKFKFITVPFDFSQKKGQTSFHNKNIVNISHLRNDIFFEPETYSLEQLDKKLNMKRFKKILLYAPTHRDKKKNIIPFSPKGLSEINNFLKKKNWAMYIKLHPLYKDVVMDKKLSNIINVTKQVCDIQEILLYSDVHITDYSSTMIDFSLTERLMLFYLYDLETYKKERGLWVDFSKDKIPGPAAFSEPEFIKMIKDIDKYEKDKKNLAKIRKYKKRYNKNTKGDSCKRVFNLLGI
nr:CDP-glycerol glycerophosphotransferase family protein [Nanoarchaeota archaeon]